MSTAVSGHSSTANQRRVAFATIIGTTIEWYDFFIYATAAGLVLSPPVLRPAGESNPAWRRSCPSPSSASASCSARSAPSSPATSATASAASAMLVITLVMMGAATALIGVLPTYAQIGVWAPILLILLRILQGISAGGEWGGAVLMAVEHAPRDQPRPRPAPSRRSVCRWA